MTYTVKKYHASLKDEWDNLIKSAKNTTFLLYRDYMDYHQDRFIDHSVMLYKEEKLVAVYPANSKEDSIQSHGGLSYGGLIYTTKLRTADVSEILEIIIKYYMEKGFVEIVYKAIPSIYCSYPSGEIEYALFLQNAELYRRDVSSTIPIDSPLKKSKGRKWLLAKGRKMELVVQESIAFNHFFEEYNIHLNNKYKTSAVHSVEEMKYLNSKFPENIRYFEVRSKIGEFLGGAILYCSNYVVHAQYIHFSEEGKKLGAFDLLMEKILEVFKEKKFFDFGISTEDNGHFLNEGLISFKESFGARATLCDFYRINLNK